jgi:hypothetical protein
MSDISIRPLAADQPLSPKKSEKEEFIDKFNRLAKTDPSAAVLFFATCYGPIESAIAEKTIEDQAKIIKKLTKMVDLTKDLQKIFNRSKEDPSQQASFQAKLDELKSYVAQLKDEVKDLDENTKQAFEDIQKSSSSGISNIWAQAEGKGPPIDPSQLFPATYDSQTSTITVTLPNKFLVDAYQSQFEQFKRDHSGNDRVPNYANATLKIVGTTVTIDCTKCDVSTKSYLGLTRNSYSNTLYDTFGNARNTLLLSVDGYTGKGLLDDAITNYNQNRPSTGEVDAQPLQKVLGAMSTLLTNASNISQQVNIEMKATQADITQRLQFSNKMSEKAFSSLKTIIGNTGRNA